MISTERATAIYQHHGEDTWIRLATINLVSARQSCLNAALRDLGRMRVKGIRCPDHIDPNSICSNLG
jgi:hypothetical protein